MLCAAPLVWSVYALWIARRIRTGPTCYHVPRPGVKGRD